MKKSNLSENDIVFSQVVKAGKRIYYLDVKKNRRDELFLAITESKKISSEDSSLPPQFEKHKIFLYKEDFDKFMSGLNEVLSYIKINNKVDFVPVREIVDEESDEIKGEEISLNIEFNS